MVAGISTKADGHDLANEGNAFAATYWHVVCQYALGFVEHLFGFWLARQNGLRDCALNVYRTIWRSSTP
jgi:hypothetical protein